MITRWYLLLLVLIVGASVPNAFDGSWFSWTAYVPLWFVAFLLAQIIAFRVFGIDVSKPADKKTLG